MTSDPESSCTVVAPRMQRCTFRPPIPTAAAAALLRKNMARNTLSRGERGAVPVMILALVLCSCQAFILGGVNPGLAILDGGAISSGANYRAALTGRLPMPPPPPISSALRSTLVAAGPAKQLETTIGIVADSEDFERAIRGGARDGKVVAIWFHATWCRKCKYIGSRLKYLEEHLPSQLTDRVTVMSLDVNKVAQVPQKQNIKGLPTIKFFAQGQDVGTYVATDRGEAFYREMERELAAAMERFKSQRKTG